MSPVSNQPSPSSADCSSRKYRSITQGPRALSTPGVSPSHGREAPSSSTILSSTPNKSRPCRVHKMSCISSDAAGAALVRSEEHTSELQSLMRISYAVFCLKKKNKTQHKSSPVITQTKITKQPNP